jgi:RND family efflux transporter MFP subunit
MTIPARRFLHLLLVVLLCTISGCSGQPDSESASHASRPRPVAAVTVAEPDGEQKISYAGQVQAGVQTGLSFEQPGTIRKIEVQRGDRVQTGQVLARLDAGDYRLAVADRRAGLKEVRARLEEARSSYERVKSLFETRNVSRRELDRSRARLTALEAREDAARNALEQAEQDFADCVLRAPLSGRVAAVPAEVHQTVQAGEPVVVVNSGEGAEVSISVPEGVISEIVPGERAEVRLDALPDKVFAARVSELGIQAGTLSAYPVVLVLEEDDDRIRAGMAAQVALQAGGQRQRIRIPAHAVVTEAGGSGYVWVVDHRKGTVHKQEVGIGTMTRHGLEVLSGLNGGETVVLRGVHHLREGMEVRVMDAGRGWDP